MLSRLVIALLAAVVAALAAGQAISAVSENLDPLAGMHMMPTNGRTLALAAELRVQQAVARTNGSMPKKLPGEAVDWARQGFLLDPSAPEAVRTLALAADLEGDKAKARALMRLTAGLSRRDSVTDLWLSEDYLSIGHPDLAYDYYNATLLTTPTAGEVLLPKMAAALDQPGMIDLMSRLLRSQPFWAADFWRQVSQSPDVAGNAAELRMKSGSPGAYDDKAINRTLLSQLVSQGKFEEAVRFYRALSGLSPQADRMTSDFSRPNDLPPFDWDLTSSGDLAASIDPRSGRLFVSASPGAFGIIARRLVRADAGSYRLAVRFTGTFDAKESLQARLRCATGQAGADTRWSEVLPAGAEPSIILSAPDSGCPYRWLELELTVPPAASVNDVAIERITLTRQ
jgi:hypothetical protein